MRRSSRFQTGGSQKSKDAIEQHKRVVDKIVRGLESEEKLYNKKFIGRLISDPGFINKILSRSNTSSGSGNRASQRPEVLPFSRGYSYHSDRHWNQKKGYWSESERKIERLCLSRWSIFVFNRPQKRLETFAL